MLATNDSGTKVVPSTLRYETLRVPTLTADSRRYLRGRRMLRPGIDRPVSFSRAGLQSTGNPSSSRSIPGGLWRGSQLSEVIPSPPLRRRCNYLSFAVWRLDRSSAVQSNRLDKRLARFVWTASRLCHSKHPGVLSEKYRFGSNNLVEK
jgi:hypothetical protein